MARAITNPTGRVAFVMARAIREYAYETGMAVGLMSILTYGSRHYQSDRQSCVRCLLAGRRLNEVSAGHHGDEAGTTHVSQRQQISGAENDLHVHAVAGSFELGIFVV